MLSVYKTQEAVGEPQRHFLGMCKIAKVPIALYAYKDIKEVQQGSYVGGGVSKVEDNKPSDLDSMVGSAKKMVIGVIPGFSDQLAYYCTQFAWPERRVQKVKAFCGGDYINYLGAVSESKEGDFDFIVNEAHTANKIFNRIFDINHGADRLGNRVPGSNLLENGSTGVKAYRYAVDNEFILDLYQFSIDRIFITDYLRLRNCQIISINPIMMELSASQGKMTTFRIHICWDYTEDDTDPNKPLEHRIIGQPYNDGLDNKSVMYPFVEQPQKS
jgi:hypothetical protein